MVDKYYVPYMEDSASDWSPHCVVKLADYEKLEQKYDNLRNAAAELLEYAEDNRPHGERESWLGPHPIDELGKLLSE